MKYTQLQKMRFQHFFGRLAPLPRYTGRDVKSGARLVASDATVRPRHICSSLLGTVPWHRLHAPGAARWLPTITSPRTSVETARTSRSPVARPVRRVHVAQMWGAPGRPSSRENRAPRVRHLRRAISNVVFFRLGLRPSIALQLDARDEQRVPPRALAQFSSRVRRSVPGDGRVHGRTQGDRDGI